MIKVYKEFEAIQFDGSNLDEINKFTGNQIITCKFVASDWVVYSRYKDKFSIYTNEQLKNTFKTKEEL